MSHDSFIHVVIDKCFLLVGGEGREGGRRDRDDYRRKEGASGDFKPEFRGGFGKLWI